MRDIKFRAKKKSDGKWVYGAYHKHLPYTPAAIRNKPTPEDDYEHCIIYDGFSDWNMPRGFEGSEVDPNTVGQLVDLKDKSGKNIYEGDIITHEVNNLIGVITWGTYGFVIENLKRTEIIADLSEYDYNPVVIGNIYENKELLA